MTRPLFVWKDENLNLLTRKPRAGVVPAPVPPTPAEHVLLAQAVAVTQPRRRKRDAIGRSWNAVGAWLAKAYLPLPSFRRASRYPHVGARWLLPYALVLVAALPFVAVEMGLWRVGP